MLIVTEFHTDYAEFIDLLCKLIVFLPFILWRTARFGWENQEALACKKTRFSLLMLCQNTWWHHPSSTHDCMKIRLLWTNFANNHSRIWFSFHTPTVLESWLYKCLSPGGWENQTSPGFRTLSHRTINCSAVFDCPTSSQPHACVTLCERPGWISFFTDAWNNKTWAVQPPCVILTHLTPDRCTGWKPWRSTRATAAAENPTKKKVNRLMNVGKLVEEICLCSDQEVSSSGQRTMSHFSSVCLCDTASRGCCFTLSASTWTSSLQVSWNT